MSYNFFVQKQIKCHKVLFIVAVAQMALSVYLILVMSDNISRFGYAGKVFRKMNSENLVYVTRTVNDNFENDFKEDELFEQFDALRTEYLQNGDNIVTATDKAWKDLGNPDANFEKINSDDISDMPYLKDTLYMETTPFITTNDPDESGSVVAVDSELSKLINYDVNQGKWLDNAQSTDKMIDVVVADNTRYKLNDILPIYDYELSFDDANDEIKYNIVDNGYKARIIGILDYGDASLDMTNTCTWLDSFNLYDMIGRYEENTLIALKEDMEECYKAYGVTEKKLDHTYVIAHLEDKIGEKQYDEIEDYLAKKRMAGVDMERIYSNTVDLERNEFSNSLIPTLAAGIFSIFSIIAISIFQMQYMNRKYQIYYYCGMEKGKEVVIQMLYSLFISTTAMILAFGIYISSGVIKYRSVIAAARKNGISENTISSWYSLSDYVHINFGAVIIIFVLTALIMLFSTMLCAFSVRYGKD
ncbi:hypothetical protein [Ruminococcus albus]|uniref:FtsX-like permease family protein n=1 Tax=Ruminococcus albus TaxID=1264 RepID=A0A1H7I088_RUMAL|nr:hypothetical protein [Ruminococcus albus]SEK55951.1 hypothetical protein SAMN05216469_103183 [Ruminococcus albus]